VTKQVWLNQQHYTFSRNNCSDSTYPKPNFAMSVAARIVRPTTRAVSARAFANAAVRWKHTLPDLSYDYGALEPAISGKIMEVGKPDRWEQFEAVAEIS
jgi:hypothetical protein